MKVKRITAIFLVVMLLFSLTSCGTDKQSEECINSLKLGLENRWEITNKDYRTYEEFKNNIVLGIDAELAQLEKYRNTQFDNKKFDETIKEYIKALDNQKKGIEYIFTDAKQYNSLYLEQGETIRSMCLNTFNKKYGLSFDSNYKENFDNILAADYTTTVAIGEQIRINAEYGEIGVKLLGFDILTNPGDDKELVLYCEVENFSYYDEWNGESILTDYFISLYDGKGYNVETKNESYDYVDEYRESAGFIDLKQGEKGKFAILFDYQENIDIVYVSLNGKSESYGCYLPSNDWLPSEGGMSKVDYDVIRQEMSNFCCDGMYNIYDGWVYSLNFPEDGGSGIFSKMRTDGSDYTVLTNKGTPYYISISGEYIYFVLGNGNTVKLYRCRLGGNDLQQITKDDVWYLQVCEDALYYNKINPSTGITSGLYRANKDGSKEELIIDKEIYYSYVVGDVVYYQDDNDKETIHKYNMTTKTDEKITLNISYSFVIDGKNAYYIKNDKSAADGDLAGSLVKIDLSTKKETILYDGVATLGIVVGEKSIYFINTNDENRIYSIAKDGKGLKLVSQDTNCSRLAIFGDKLIYQDYDSNGELVDAIYLCDSDGSDKIRISKNE